MSTEQSLWVIGDIHGMLDPLMVLLNTIRTIEYQRERRTILVFLGDYIDHGPCSREVVDALLDASREFGVVFMAGNHEDMMLQFLDPDPGLEDYGKAWFDGNGGQATVCSFMNSRAVLSKLWMRSVNAHTFAAADLRLDAEYRAFLNSLAYIHTEEIALGARQSLRLVFSHASLYRRSDCRLQPRPDDPELPIEEQLAVATRHDFQALLRRRPMWLDNYHIWNRELPQAKFGDFLLIHGHTPTPIIDSIHPGRLGAYDPKSALPLVMLSGGRVGVPSSGPDLLRYEARLSDVVSMNIDTGVVYGHALTALNFSSRRLRDDCRIGVVQVHAGRTHRDFGACSRFHLQFTGP
jgi:hypothetical protein